LFAVAALTSFVLADETACNLFGGENVEYLDRHRVKCPDNHGLKDWTFTRCDNQNFKAVYNCHALPGQAGTLTERNTGCSHLSGQNLEFLDRQNLACAAGEVMEGFQLHRDGCGGDDMRFRIFCRQHDVSSTYVAHAGSTNCNEIDGQNLEYLDRHVPDCVSNFMSQWYMTRFGCAGSNQRIALTCIELAAPTCDYGCYLNRYEDLQNAFGGDRVAAMNHYRDHGRHEGRDCTCPPPDCAGTPGGDAVVDECGVCNGDNSSCADCAGTPNGSSVEDECGVCDGDNTSCADCAGTPNGSSVIDECGVCDGDNSSCADCAGTPNGSAVEDECGVCDGDNTSCNLPIDTLDKLKAWCSEDVAHCRICKGKDEDDGSCRVKDKKIAKCKLFKNNEVCDRIVGCRTVVKVKKNKTKTTCKGGKHGLA